MLLQSAGRGHPPLSCLNGDTEIPMSARAQERFEAEMRAAFGPSATLACSPQENCWSTDEFSMAAWSYGCISRSQEGAG
jgi:hypothetical protein